MNLIELPSQSRKHRLDIQHTEIEIIIIDGKAVKRSCEVTLAGLKPYVLPVIMTSVTLQVPSSRLIAIEIDILARLICIENVETLH